MKKVVVFMGRYCPGYKDGGPIRTVINLTGLLGEEYEFQVVCLDRDSGDKTAYENINRDDWNQVGKAKVWYLPPGGFTFSAIRHFAAAADVVYCCGFYDDYGYKTLILRKLGLLKKTRVAVASMGTFSPGALALKRVKKKLFINIFRMLGLFKNIVWSVSSELEKNDVQRVIGKDACCVIASDIPRQQILECKNSSTDARLKVAFLSRVSPKKNLIGAIKILKNIESLIDFTIYGPIEDENYWKKCQTLLAELPENVTWNYAGNVPSENVLETLGGHDVFLFPTWGENYGHVIFEALAAGTIPVISDQTPWQCIADAKAGYVLPLSDGMENFVAALQEIADQSPEMRSDMINNARQVAAEKIADARKYTGYRTVFDGNY